MNTYRVNPIAGGGFKVNVADGAGGLRVVGVFMSEADADAWIEADSGRTTQPAGEPDRPDGKGQWGKRKWGKSKWG